MKLVIPELEISFQEYSDRAWATAIFPKGDYDYAFHGLAGESGEVSQLRKKAIRDSAGLLDPDVLAKELGDVLWYVNAIAKQHGLSLAGIAKGNVEKLESRQARGKLQGSGDNR